MFHILDNTVAFTTLDRGQQAAIWNSFFEAVDAGWAGHHPFYADLAPLYAEGAYVCCEVAAPFEPAAASIAEAVIVELDEPPPF